MFARAISRQRKPSFTSLIRIATTETLNRCAKGPQQLKQRVVELLPERPGSRGDSSPQSIGEDNAVLAPQDSRL